MANESRDQSASRATRAAILLCGGESRRMGRPKWSLPFGDETMFERMARVLQEVVETIIVVGPAKGEVPKFGLAEKGSTTVARDRTAGRGPLEGLAVGLAIAAAAGSEFSFVTACDTPLLRPDFVRRMFELADGYDAAVPRVVDGVHPLAAVYATRLLPQLEEVLEAGERRAQILAELASTRWVTAKDLAAVDPQLLSLRNVNTPDEYAAALADAGASRA